MSFTGSTELNQMGGIPGGWGGFGGGIGGVGLVGLVGLNSLIDRDRKGDGDCCEDIKNNARNLAILESIQNTKDAVIAGEANLRNAICDTEKTALQQFYAAAIQAANNTQSIKDQASSFAVVNDARFDALERAGVNQTATILARINDVENQNLRDQLFETRRRVDAREQEINIINTNTNLNAQVQAQAQVQTQRDFDLHRRLDGLFGSFNQLNKSTNDVINFGTMAASGNQANQQTNVK